MARSSPTLLVIDDNRSYQRLIQELLAEAGHPEATVRWAGTLAQGLSWLADHRVDLVMLDLLLPDNMGLDTVERFRQAAPEVPLVVFTGVEDDLVPAQVLAAGAQAHLAKGELTAEAMAATLGRVLRLEPGADQRARVAASTAALRGQIAERLDELGHAVGRLDDPAADRDIPYLQTEIRLAEQRLARFLGYLDTGDLDRPRPTSSETAFRTALGRLHARGLITRARLTREPLPPVGGHLGPLASILELLLENGIVHNPDPYPHVHVTARTSEGAITLTVTDDGPGLPEDLAGSLFEPFTSQDPEHTQERGGSGAGLGLAVARNLARRMGGELAASPGPSGGACFTLRLPHPRPVTSASERAPRDQAGGSEAIHELAPPSGSPRPQET